MTSATAGELKDRVTWQMPVRTADGAGQKQLDWETVKETWAKVDPIGGSESDQQSRQVQNRVYEVTIRSRTVGVLHDWRLLWKNRSDLVLHVTNVGPHPNGEEWVLVSCKERSASTTG